MKLQACPKPHSAVKSVVHAIIYQANLGRALAQSKAQCNQQTFGVLVLVICQPRPPGGQLLLCFLSGSRLQVTLLSSTENILVKTIRQDKQGVHRHGRSFDFGSPKALADVLH